MEALASYLPADRRYVLAQNRTLAERSNGAALFADISGFTPMTELLVRALGPQRGADELPQQLNRIYDALIAEVDRFGGSVMSFSGDAITCWFASVALDSPATEPIDASHQALACALAMQATMQQFAKVEIHGAGTVEMALKTSVTTGPVRRFIVGDPQIQLIDVLAGETIMRLARAEHLANKGEVVVDQATCDALGERLAIGDWRSEPGESEQFAVVKALREAPPERAWDQSVTQSLSQERLRPWLLPPVFNRLMEGQGEFLTELRPAAALFLRFDGIDYDHDPDAQSKLDSFIQAVQRILFKYDSFLGQLTIGDKGSYLYTAFGAPSAHEDDAIRAAKAALELRDLHTTLGGSIQIGISEGRMRTGAYGGVTRRTYGALGDEVNMAARLMQYAPPNTIIATINLRKSTGELFNWSMHAPIKVKGKQEPALIFELKSQQDEGLLELHASQYERPMVGRKAELAQLNQLLDQSLTGQGQLVELTAEAGMGKSRLLAEALKYAQQLAVQGFAGECQSYGTTTSYLVWRWIWRSFFGIQQLRSLPEQIEQLSAVLASYNPELVPRLPLLGVVLDLDIPDNELTRSFDTTLRKASLESLLVECVQSRARETPLLFILEDCHWIDPLSRDLLEVLARAIADLPAMIVLTYRPTLLHETIGLPLQGLSNLSEIKLKSLASSEIKELVGNKLVEMYGPRKPVPDGLVVRLIVRTEGNPFYIEELLNFLRDNNIDLDHPQAIQQAELPPSLHSLILSRLDTLSEDQRSLIKMASVIGRIFQVAMLWGISGSFGLHDRLSQSLETLSQLEFTVQSRPDPDLAYLFKHLITQEVAYESLAYATRAVLHDQIAQYIEQHYVDDIEPYIDLLAFHFDRSHNETKRREYLLKAADAAANDGANTTAIDYYRRLLPLLGHHERSTVLLKLAQVLERTGQWQETYDAFSEALGYAEQAQDRAQQAQIQALIGELLRKQGNYGQAETWLQKALALASDLDDQAKLAQILHYLGSLELTQGQLGPAKSFFERSLSIHRAQADLQAAANSISNLSIIAYYEGDAAQAEQLAHEALGLRRQVGNRIWVANSLGNLGMLAFEAGRYQEAKQFMSEALKIERQVGDRAAIAISLNNLGNVARELNEYSQAANYYRDSMRMSRELGNTWGLTYLLEDIGVLAALRGVHDHALRLVAAAESLRIQINAPLSEPEQAALDRKIEAARSTLGEQADAVWQAGKALPYEQAIVLALELEL